MQSHIHKVYVCLAVTCHLHFWQNDPDLLHATVVTQGWNGYRVMTSIIYNSVHLKGNQIAIYPFQKQNKKTHLKTIISECKKIRFKSVFFNYCFFKLTSLSRWTGLRGMIKVYWFDLKTTPLVCACTGMFVCIEVRTHVHTVVCVCVCMCGVFMHACVCACAHGMHAFMCTQVSALALGWNLCMCAKSACQYVYTQTYTCVYVLVVVRKETIPQWSWPDSDQ